MSEDNDDVIERIRAARVRRISATKKTRDRDRFAQLKQMSCFEEVLVMISEGTPAAKIAEYIHRVAKEYTDISQKMLTDLIKRFVADEYHAYEESTTAMIRTPETLPEGHPDFDRALEEERMVNVAHEMYGLYDIQMKRVKRGIKKEDDDDTLDPQVGREIKTAGVLLKQIHSVQQDLGISARTPQRVNHMHAHLMVDAAPEDPAAAQISDSPAKRNAISSLVERLTTLDPGMTESIMLGLGSSDEQDQDEDIIDVEVTDA